MFLHNFIIIMAATLNINNILSQVAKLDKEDQLSLLQRIVPLLKRSAKTAGSPLPLSSISGIGSEIWKDINIDNYIDHERRW